MSNQTTNFVMTIPCTEEDMIAVAQEVIRMDKSRQNYLNTIESLEQLVGVMKDYLVMRDSNKGTQNQ